MTISRLVVALAVAVVASGLAHSAVPTASASMPPVADLTDPETDPFFTAPADLGELAPGTVIRSRPVTAKVGVGGLALPMGATATQVFLRSTDVKGRPVAVTSTVLTPRVGARHQLLSYQPATDSLGAMCEPSYTLQAGTEKESAAMFAAVSRGLTVVVPDHQGPRHAFSAGRMAGHAVLDSIRAAIQLPAAELDGPATKVAMMGYSGGAIATGWAAQLHPRYAPELNVVGVASGGTPADLYAASQLMDGSVSGGLFVGAALGMAREYPELLTLFDDKGHAYAERVKDACMVELVSHPFMSVNDLSWHPDPLQSEVGKAVLKENRMGRLAPTAPVLLWHSRLDQLIPWAAAKTLHGEWCASGTRVRMVTDVVSEHVIGGVTWVPQAQQWLIARLNGQSFVDNCPV